MAIGCFYTFRIFPIIIILSGSVYSALFIHNSERIHGTSQWRFARILFFVDEQLSDTNSTMNAEDSHDVDVFELNALIQKEISQLQNELNVLLRPDMCVETESSSLDEEDKEPSDQRRDHHILSHSCKVLRAQLRTYKPATYTCEPWFLGEEDINSQMRERVRQTEECISLQQKQKQELVNTVDHESKVSLELEELLRAMENKFQSAMKKKQRQQSENRRDELHKKYTRMAKVNVDLENKMATFTTERFPLPDEKAFKKMKSKESSSSGPGLRTREDLISLQETVQQLVDAAASDHNNSYIKKDHRHWPPYLSLLQRMDLAAEHPEDSNRIRLMHFYL